MVLAARTRSRRRSWLLGPAVALMCLVAGLAAGAGTALGAQFERGDVFLAASGGVQEYTPAGTLVQTIPGSGGATSMCFDPSGAHLILPGVGLFNDNGGALPSNWASATPGRCVADGSGNVYVVTRDASFVWTIAKYDLKGNLLQAFHPAPFAGEGPFAIDLAPDNCTAYYGNSNSSPVGGTGFVGIGRFNVCTGAQAPFFGASNFVNDLRVLPDRQVLTTDDPNANLFDASGGFVRSYYPGGGPFTNSDTLQTLSLAPDEKSFWVCCAAIPNSSQPKRVFHFDTDSGDLLASWIPGDATAADGPMSTYTPPALGDANVERHVDAARAGTAEAFRTKAAFTGQLSRLHLWVDSSSTARTITVGIYAERHGLPAQLKGEGTITAVQAGSWNFVDVSSVPVTAGEHWWLAVLSPRGGTAVSFRDGRRCGLSVQSSGSHLADLPDRWSSGRLSVAGPLSAYGS